MPEGLVSRADSFEAMAWQMAELGNVKGAIESCRDWLSDEPFSAKPAIMGSYLGMVSGEAIEAALELAKDGLVANPGNELLLNNLAVAQAEMGRLEEAARTLARVRRTGLAKNVAVTVRVTEGLLRTKGGDWSGGRILYEEAVAMARETGDENLVNMVSVHLEIERARSSRRSDGLKSVLERLREERDLGLRLALRRGAAVLEKATAGQRMGEEGTVGDDQ